MSNNTSRIAVCNAEELLESMPDFPARAANLEQFASIGEDRLDKMELHLVEHSQNMEANYKAMNEKQRSKSEEKLLKLQDEIHEARERFDKEYEGKRKQQLGPLLKNLDAAIAKVAQDSGYTHVLNSSNEFPVVLYVQPGDQIDELVKAELQNTSES